MAPEFKKLEERLAAFTGTKDRIIMASGTEAAQQDAVVAAMRAAVAAPG